MAFTQKLISFVKPGGSLFLILSMDNNDQIKLTNWFWSTYPNFKLFHYQSFPKFIHSLDNYGRITTKKIDCCYEFNSDQIVEVVGASILAVPRKLITYDLQKAITEYSQQFKTEKGSIKITSTCLLVEINIF